MGPQTWNRLDHLPDAVVIVQPVKNDGIPVLPGIRSAPDALEEILGHEEVEAAVDLFVGRLAS